MANATSPKASETATPAAVAAPVSDAAALVAAAKAAKKAQDDAERESRKAVNGAQTAAREVLGCGISDLAKLCRRFVAAQGSDAAERTAELVRALHGVVGKFSK